MSLLDDTFSIISWMLTRVNPACTWPCILFRLLIEIEVAIIYYSSICQLSFKWVPGCLRNFLLLPSFYQAIHI